MPWISVIEEEQATGELGQLYEEMKEPWGGVDNILKIQSLNPASLRGHFEFYKTLMRGPSSQPRPKRNARGRGFSGQSLPLLNPASRGGSPSLN